MALAAPRCSSRSLPAPARLLPAPLSGPPRPQPPPPGRSAAGRGAGGGRGAAPAPLSARSGERPRAGPGGEERCGGPCGPAPPNQPPPACPGWLGCAEDARKVSVLGGFKRPRPDSGSLPQLGSWARVPHGWRLSPRQRLTTSCRPSCIKHRGGQLLSPTLPGLHWCNANYPKQEFKSSISVPEY